MFGWSQALRDLAGLISHGILSQLGGIGWTGQTFLHAQLGCCNLLLFRAVCVGSCLLLCFLYRALAWAASGLLGIGFGMCIPWTIFSAWWRYTKAGRLREDVPGAVLVAWRPSPTAYRGR